MVSDDKVKSLFRAFRDRNEKAFIKTAESIISEELAANHHNLATQLKKALGHPRAASKENTHRNELTTMLRDRRKGESLIALQDSKVSQSRIVLSDEPRSKVERIISEHRKRSKLSKYGYSPKNKLLFWGPPGCGKTFTAYYIAHELGFPVGVLRLNAVISSFLGDTASNIQRVFDLANRRTLVLLLDEVDSVGKNRDDPNDVGELKRVVNSLLQAMDSFWSDSSLVIAASNHQYLLDPAIWRRFDDLVNFPLPGRAEREAHLRLLLNGVRFEGSFQNLAKRITSISYADIEKIVVEGIKTMILQDRQRLTSADLMKEFRAHRKDLSAVQASSRGLNK